MVDGMECVEYLPGDFVHPYRWSDEGLHEIGRMTARLHRASRGFLPDEAVGCAPWCLREIGGEERLWSHGDIAPWNTIAVGGLPTRLIDWEFAGPIDPLVELARVCWLFVQLVDDDLAVMYGLPGAEVRARQVGVVLDGYGLARRARAGMAERILEVAICETAHEAIDPGVRPPDVGSLWGFAWRTRSVYWIWRHRRLLEETLGQGGAG
ncbi:MAG: phosphotransferase [Clostridiales bacterium]|nr:phosphotransferase [Clostridiales bacterium]